MKTRLLPLLLSLCLLAGCETPSMQLRSATKSYHLQNFNLALRDIMPLAKRGKPQAQYALGYMYFYAQGMSEDRAKAIRWMQKAADQNYYPAQQALVMIEQQEHAKAKRNGRAKT